MLLTRQIGILQIREIKKKIILIIGNFISLTNNEVNHKIIAHQLLQFDALILSITNGKHFSKINVYKEKNMAANIFASSSIHID